MSDQERLGHRTRAEDGGIAPENDYPDGEMSSAFYKKAVRASIWAVSLNTANRAFQLLRLIVLARLLAPVDFGVLGIALLTIAALETFSQTGFDAALIHSKGKIGGYLDTAWMVSVLRGLAIFALLLVTAPLVGRFFEHQETSGILRAIGLALLLRGFTSVGAVLFLKELNFRKRFVYQFSGTVADFLVAVTLAFLLRSAWALVWAFVTGEAVRCVVSYVIHPYRPKVALDPRKAAELFRFGRWILGSSVVVFLLLHGDDALVGKVLGVAALGFYQMAYAISNTPATEITRVASQVAFPAYSRLQDNPHRLRRAYLRTLQITALISVPLAGWLFIIAPEFVSIFMGEKWMPMVPAMRVLCVFGMTRSINATLGPLFQGMGKPAVVTKTGAFQLVVMAALIWPLTIRWGIVGTSIAVVTPNLLALIYLGKRCLSELHVGLTAFARMVIYPVISTVLMMLSIMLVKPLVSGHTLGGFSLLMITGVLVNALAVYLLDKLAKYQLMPSIMEVVRVATARERKL